MQIADREDSVVRISITLLNFRQGSYVLQGIKQFSDHLHFPVKYCTGTQISRGGWVSGSRDTWLHNFRVSWGCKGEQFVISEPDEIHRRSRVTLHPLTALVETSKLVVTTHFTTSPLRHD